MKVAKKAALVAVALAFVVLVVIGYFLWSKRTPDVTVPANVPPTWGAVRSSPGHTKHLTSKKGSIMCRDCHDESNGKFVVLGEAACAKCHEPQAKLTHVGKPGADHTPCTTCHAFGVKPEATCTSCHAEPQGKRAAVTVHASKDVPCKACHSPHRDPEVQQADCATCHGNVTASHGNKHVASDVTHARGWLDGGAGATLATTAAAGGPACTDCHAPHTKAAVAGATCIGCHASAPKGPRPSNHAACTTCHAPHELERAAVKPCAGCHADKRAASDNPAHAACTSCHVAHDTPAKRSVCASCHAAQHTLADTKVAKHADCTSCHSPHDPKASPAAACAKCHANINAKHAPGKSDRCVDCHAPHPTAAKAGHPASTLGAPGNPAIALACATCHKTAKSDTAFHAKGVACATCHAPHNFSLAGSGAASCQGCHAPQQKLVAVTKGHADCLQCHDGPHTPTQQKATCASCHKAEASTAHAGHTVCKTCHEPHAGKVLPAAVSCKSCHAKEGASAHARVDGATSTNVNVSCNTCHRPHGPGGVASPPACTTCHSPGSLPSLHRVGAKDGKGHASCPTCHTAHDPAKAAHADRATCTTCHANKKDHQPDAKVCSGCHVFSGGARP